MRFYVLENPEVGENDAVTDFDSVGKLKLGEASRCPSCSNFTSMLPWLPPFRGALRLWGCEFGDYAWGGSDMLFSQRLVNEWLYEGLKGLEILDRVAITRVIPKRMTDKAPPYYLARVIRTRTLVDDVASGIRYEHPWTCDECRIGQNLLEVKRVIVDESTWTGEDIFEARNLAGTYITTERFKEFCERHQFRNIKLVPAEEYSIDYTFGKR